MSPARVLRRADPGYEQRRRAAVWQQRVPARYPASIVAVADAADVASALGQARNDGRRAAVVGSGHSYTGNGLQDDVVLLDLSALRDVEVDPASRRARVGPAATHADLDAELVRHGLAFPVGHSPSVGLGGYLLGGGLGWNPGAWGVGAAHVVGATAVLASGEVVRADAEHHPDLLWAVRGGGPLVPAVVVELELGLLQRPRAITEVRAQYPAAASAAVAGWVSAALPHLADGVDLSVVMVRDGAGASVAVTAVAFADDPREAERWLAPLRQNLPQRPRPQLSERRCDLSDLVAQGDAPARRTSVAGVWSASPASVLQAGSDWLAAPCASGSDAGSSDLLHVQLRSHPEIPPEAAFSVCEAAFVFAELTWDDADADQLHLGRHDALLDELGPLTSGYYVNETDVVRHPHLLPQCFSPAGWHRLGQVRLEHDPEELLSGPPVERGAIST